jgi:hypothetical protein
LITTTRKPDCVEVIPRFGDYSSGPFKAGDRVFAPRKLGNIYGPIGFEIVIDDKTSVVAQVLWSDNAGRIVTDSDSEHARALQLASTYPPFKVGPDRRNIAASSVRPNVAHIGNPIWRNFSYLDLLCDPFGVS